MTGTLYVVCEGRLHELAPGRSYNVGSAAGSDIRLADGPEQALVIRHLGHWTVGVAAGGVAALDGSAVAGSLIHLRDTTTARELTLVPDGSGSRIRLVMATELGALPTLGDLGGVAAAAAAAHRTPAPAARPAAPPKAAPRQVPKPPRKAAVPTPGPAAPVPAPEPAPAAADDPAAVTLPPGAAILPVLTGLSTLDLDWDGRPVFETAGRIFADDGFAGVLSVMSRAVRDQSRAQVTEAVDRALRVSLADVLKYGWSKEVSLLKAGWETSRNPGTVQTVELADYPFSSVHHPSVAVMMDGAKAAEVVFTLTIEVVIHAMAATVTGGRLVRFECGRCEVQAAVEVAGHRLLSKSTEIRPELVVDLRGGLPLIPGAPTGVAG